MLRLLLSLASMALAADRLALPMRLPVARSLTTSSSKVDVTNHLATQYIVSITIAGKNYDVQVDTGSADLWVACSAVGSSACMSPCPANGVTIYYGSGDACLVPNTGSVSLGGLTLPEGIYGVGMNNNVLTNATSGILGLAYPVLSTFNTTNNASYLVSHLESFSMYLTAEPDASGSSLILNGLDDELVAKNKLVGVTVPLAPNQTSHWNILIDSFAVDGNALAPCKNLVNGCIAVVDSGTTFLSMPRFLFTQFASKYLLPQQCVWQASYYVCPKSVVLPPLSLMLHNTTFTLNSWDYSMVYSESQILVQLQMTPPGGSSGDRWILGDTFLKVYYTEYLVAEQAVRFYCPSGICGGGRNILDFSGKTSHWALGLFIGGGCLIGLALLALLYYWYKKRRGTTLRSSQALISLVDASAYSSHVV
ncbi:gastricsin [Achlya hypogyna]|uniref:Gastricsin n=1 Tax=Achlya hypogyna TaxID=1202772 RepID=A0A1V9YW79_ACHHY|nr:gastricsin [Achlya hypogyna]